MPFQLQLTVGVNTAKWLWSQGSFTMARAPLTLPDRHPELDGLRGCACLLVLAFHYLYQSLENDSPSKWKGSLLATLHLSWTGVDLFFVLSGFLLGGILLRHREAPNLFKVFYLRRACRILPLYFSWLSLFAFLSLILPATRFQCLNNARIPSWPYWVFCQNIFMAIKSSVGCTWLAPTWSLAVEEQFYLVLPLLITRVPHRHLPKILPDER